MNKKDRFMLWLAWKLPKSIVYWCAVRLAASASAHPKFVGEVPNLTIMTALKLWREKDLSGGPMRLWEQVELWEK